MSAPYSPTQPPLSTISPTSPTVNDDSGNHTLPLSQGQFESIQGVMVQILKGVNSQAEHLGRLPLSHEVGVAMLAAKLERLNEEQERNRELTLNLGRLLVSLLQSPHDADIQAGQCGLCAGSHPWEFCPVSTPGSHCCRCWDLDHTSARFVVYL